MARLTLLAAALALVAQILLHNRLVFPLALALAIAAGLLAYRGAAGRDSALVPRRGIRAGGATPEAHIPAPLTEEPSRARGPEPAARRLPWTRGEVAGLVALIAVAFVARLFQNADWPVGGTYDESANGVEAIRFMLNPTFPIWSDALSGRPTLHLHVLAVAFRVFGPTPEVLRGVSAAVGVLAILPLYLIGRDVGGRPLAFAAAGFLAIFRWDVAYSRIGYEAIFGPLFAACAIYLFARGVSERRLLFFALCGVSVAAGLYTYVAFRLFPFAVGAMAVVALVGEWRTGERARVVWLLRALGVALVAALLVAAPLLNFARTDWSRFSYRFREVSILNEVQAKGDAGPLVESALRHVGMFNYRGGIGAATNLPFRDAWDPGYPMLGIPFAAFFLVGFFRNLTRLGAPLGMGMLATLVTSLAAGTLTVLEETPHQTRALIAVIPAALLAGEGLVAVTTVGLREWRFGLARSVPLVVAAGLVAAAIAEADTYRRQIAHPEAWWDYDGRATRVAQGVRSLPPGGKAVLSADLKQFPADAIVRFVGGRELESIDMMDPLLTLPHRGAGGSVRYLLSIADYQIFADGLAAVYPEAQTVIEKDPFDRALAVRVDVPQQSVERTLGLRHELFAMPDCTGMPVDVRTERGPRFGSSPQPDSVRCERWSGVVFIPRTGPYRTTS